MPIEQIDDYPETMTEFELHWGSVNAALGGAPATDFELLGDYTLADFSADKAAVVTALSDQEGLDNNVDFARSDRDQTRTDLRQRLILFRETAKALLPGSRYLRALPDTPAEQAEAQKLLDAWDDIAHVWAQINTDQPPEIAPAMQLRGGYTLAQFQTEVGTMRTRYDAVKAAERAAGDGRGQRDELLQAAYTRMVQYRERLPVTLDPGDPLLASMPQVTASPGSTPDAVTLSGQWNSSPGSGLLTWNESTSPNLDHYLVRFSPGATYDSGNSSVSANLPPGTTVHETLDGLASPGDTASFKVFVVLTTGNQAGSNTTTITRP